MKTAIADALESKKFLAFLVTIIVVGGNKCIGHWGYELDASQVALLVGTGAVYILGQGIADHGKSAADTNAALAAAIAMDPSSSKDAALKTLAGIASGTQVAPPPKSSQSGFVRLGLCVVIAMAGAMVLFGCGGATARQTALMASMASLDATKAGLAAYDAKVEQQMLADATDKATLDATKAAYRAKVDKLVTDIATAADAIDKAWKADTDPSVATAVAAVAAAGTLLVTIGVAK